MFLFKKKKKVWRVFLYSFFYSSPGSSIKIYRRCFPFYAQLKIMMMMSQWLLFRTTAFFPTISFSTPHGDQHLIVGKLQSQISISSRIMKYTIPFFALSLFTYERGNLENRESLKKIGQTGDYCKKASWIFSSTSTLCQSQKLHLTFGSFPLWCL